MTEANWGIVAARIGLEEFVEDRLRQSGYRVYLPRYRKILQGIRIGDDGRRIRCRGPGTPVLRPLLAGFLFAELHTGQWLPRDIADRWRHWRWNNARAFVSEAAIERLRQVEGEGQFDEVRDDGVRAGLRTGCAAEAEIAGQRLAVVVDDLSDPDRVIVQAMMFNREIPLIVKARDLYPVSA